MFADLLSRGGLSLDRLQNFCAVAAVGGITKAAQGDPVRQSLFSRQIKELEEFFGVELVRRKGRGIALTEAGEQLHTLAREQLLRLSDFKRESAGQPVELTVAAGESLIEWLLLPRLGRIRGKLPNTTFRFLNLPTAEIASRLRDGTVDLGLVRAGSLVAPLKAVALGAMTFSLFVPAQARFNPHGGKVTAKVLSSMPLATLEGTGHFRQELQGVVSRAKCRLRIELGLPSFPLVARAVRAGGFAAILPTIAAAELTDSGVIELKPDCLRPLSRPIVLAWNPRLARIRGALDKAIPVFSEFCQLAAANPGKR